VMLQRTGPLNQALIRLGVIDEPLALVNNFTGTAIAMTHIMVPFMILTLLAMMRSIDGQLIRAARSLGASGAEAFWTVFFPLSLPGLLAGAVLIFVMSLGYYVIPTFLGGGRILMWSMKIESNINVYPDWGAASALGVVLLVIVLVLLWLCRFLVATVARRMG
jgi:ABC-type spermidine/putrescine transport system permease subunit I